MEKGILSTLPYNLLNPSPINFYEYLSLFLGLDKRAYLFGKFLMELFLYDSYFIYFRPSIISCSCDYLAVRNFPINNYKEFCQNHLYKIDGEEEYETEIG